MTSRSGRWPLRISVAAAGWILLMLFVLLVLRAYQADAHASVAG